MPDASVKRTIWRLAPDVVRLASPIVLGAAGLRAARQLGMPTVTEARQVVRQRTWAQLEDQLIAVHYAAVLGPDSTLAAA